MKHPTKKPCAEYHVNAQAQDFSCALTAGHGGPHRDPSTGTLWNHGVVPIGMKKRKKHGGGE